MNYRIIVQTFDRIKFEFFISLYLFVQNRFFKVKVLIIPLFVLNGLLLGSFDANPLITL